MLTAAAPPLILPHLREDLRLLKSGEAEDGSPTWLLYDPVRNRHFRIGQTAFRLLSLWRGGELAAATMERVQTEGVALADDELQEMVRFLVSNGLTAAKSAADVQRLTEEHTRSRLHWLTWLIHNYLFIRIPLLRPDAFLERSLPLVRPLFDRRLRLAIRLLGLLGLLLALRRWDQFRATFLHFFSWDGLALYGLTLVLVKVAHELGHAYAAKRRGCRIASMGVAFLVLFPVLYTDTTDAWRLRSRRDRLAVALAGLAVELHLALLATFLWSFLPDGPFRSAAFFVATTSWVASMAVNISPFMRFDGYYALADWLNADNLQPRAFALGRWQLRELLFGFNEPPPEPLPPERRHLFVIYAWGTWVYRFFLFVGIAFMVYHWAFKALGLILFTVEIGWFVLLPLRTEVGAWWKRRGQITFNRRSAAPLLLLILGLGMLVIPWRHTLTLPAVLEAERFTRIYPSEPCQVVEVHIQEGQKVQEGEILIAFASPLLKHETAQIRQRIELLRLRLDRRGGSPEDLQSAFVLQEDLARQESALAGLAVRSARLILRAPFSGTVSRRADLRPGQWVSPKQVLLHLVAPDQARAIAFITGDDLRRVRIGAEARFIAADGQHRKVALRVTALDETAVPLLPFQALASLYGGPIAVRAVSENELRPEQALYRLTLQPVGDTSSPRWQLPGTVLVTGDRRSWIMNLAREAAAVLVRESGF